MDTETRLKLLEEYCFQQNNRFQTDVFEAVQNKLESGEGFGFGKRLSPDTPALVAVYAPNKGILFSNMTEDQRDDIIDPLAGLVIYNTDTNKLNLYTTTWEEITSA